VETGQSHAHGGGEEEGEEEEGSISFAGSPRRRLPTLVVDESGERTRPADDTSLNTVNRRIAEVRRLS
jgi:hypothetical protein